MCRMLGMVSNLETYLNFSYNVLAVILKKLCEERGECHKHGSGFAWYQNGWNVKRDDGPLWESKDLKSFITYTRSKAMIIHARKATYPQYSPQGPKVENSHPFMAELRGLKWVFAHNGRVLFKKNVFNLRFSERILEYRGKIYKLISYGVDSEIFFRILLHTVDEIGGEEPRNVIDALRKTISEEIIEKFYSLNFIMGSHRYLYAFRFYNEEEVEPDRYTLYYMIRRGTSEAGKILRKKLSEIDLYISSEPLTSEKWVEDIRKFKEGFPVEEWIPLKNGEILVVPIGKPTKIIIEKI